MSSKDSIKFGQHNQHSPLQSITLSNSRANIVSVQHCFCVLFSMWHAPRLQRLLMPQVSPWHQKKEETSIMKSKKMMSSFSWKPINWIPSGSDGSVDALCNKRKRWLSCQESERFLNAQCSKLQRLCFPQKNLGFILGCLYWDVLYLKYRIKFCRLLTEIQEIRDCSSDQKPTLKKYHLHT